MKTPSPCAVAECGWLACTYRPAPLVSHVLPEKPRAANSPRISPDEVATGWNPEFSKADLASIVPNVALFLLEYVELNCGGLVELDRTSIPFAMV